jgi:CRP/FNR family transcriptional regulator
MSDNGKILDQDKLLIDFAACAIAHLSPISKFCLEGRPIDLFQKLYLNFDKDEILFKEREEAKGVFCIHSGHVKLVKRGKDDKDYIVRLTKPGDLIDLTLFTSPRHTSTAIAIDDVQTCYIPKGEFVHMLKKDSCFTIKLMKFLCTEIEATEKRITGLCQKTARQRVAEVLLALKAMYGTDKQQYLNILLSMKDLANFSCTSSATLSRLLSEFKQKNLIRIRNHKIKLLQQEKLIQIAKLAYPV